MGLLPRGRLPSPSSCFCHPSPALAPHPRTPTWCRNTCCCFYYTAASPPAGREESVSARPGAHPPPPAALGSQYLGGGFDEPLFLFQGGDDGDVAHRLVGVLLVLGDTHDRGSFLRSATCQAKPGFPQEPSEPLCQGHPLLVEGASGNRNCQLASRTPFPENLKSRYQGVEAGSWP